MADNGQLLEQRKETSRYFRYLSEAVLETDSIDEALDSVEVALSLAPEPAPIPVTIDAYFSHDIENSAAQGILNKIKAASAALTAEARRVLGHILKTASFQEMTGQLVRWLDRYRLQLARLLGRAQLAALLTGAREIAEKLPAVPLGANLPAIPPTLSPEQAVKLVDKVRGARTDEEREQILATHPRTHQEYVRRTLMAEALVPPFPETPWLPETGDPDDLVFPVIEEGVRLLQEKRLVTRAQFDALDNAARQKAFTIAGVESQTTLGKIRDSLADALQKGISRETWEQEVLQAVDEGTFLSETHLDTVYRAAIQAALSDGQKAVLSHPFIRSGFPYVGYFAIHDDRVRHNHLALEKHGIGGSNIYRIDDPVFETFRPPWDFGDRCNWTALTVEQAAREGVEEAIKWLKEGTEPQPPARVPWPPFRPPAAFQRALAGAPLSIQLAVAVPIVIEPAPALPAPDIPALVVRDRASACKHRVRGRKYRQR